MQQPPKISEKDSESQSLVGLTASSNSYITIVKLATKFTLTCSLSFQTKGATSHDCRNETILQ